MLQTLPLKDLIIERFEKLSQNDFYSQSYSRVLKIDFKGEIHLTPNKVKSGLRIIQPGDLVLSRINAGRGAISLNRNTEKLAATKHYGIFAIRNDIINPELLYNLLRSHEMLIKFSLQLRPGIKAELSNKTIVEYKITFPVRLEDQSLLLEQIDSRMEGINHFEIGIRQFRFLLDIVRQRLLQEYFKENSQIHEKNRHKQDISGRGWDYAKLKDIAALKVGKTPPQKHFKNDGIPFLKVQNIVNQSISINTNGFYTEKESHLRYFAKFPALPGDILMNIVGPPLGKIAVFPEQLVEAGYNQGIVNIRPIQADLSNWIFWYLNEMSAIRNLPKTGIAGQENISIKQIKNISIPLPAREQREKILQKLEQHFFLLGKLDSRCENLSRLNELLKTKIISYTLSLSDKNG